MDNTFQEAKIMDAQDYWATSQSKAAAVLDVGVNELEAFEEYDAFNKHILSGYLCKRSDHRYGALVIVNIDGEDCFQIILATPKLHYPFGRTGDERRVYNWPKKIKEIRVYEKLDGTNICAYSYEVPGGERKVTFKTRLTPVLKKSRFGDFYSLWSEVLERNPKLRVSLMAPSSVSNGVLSMSFELWGYRNSHLIAYEEPLEATHLFSVDQDDGSILPPCEKPLSVAHGPGDITKLYEGLRGKANELNRVLSDDAVSGIEGYVFYVLDEANQWTMWKCKPEMIEAVHWAGEFLPVSVIFPTAWNALESCAKLTAKYVSELLREEFTANQVAKSQNRVEEVVEKVNRRVWWREDVLTTYIYIDMPIKEHGKNAVMRRMSDYYPKEKMRDVFTALKELNIVD
jgi:hypothetical protein